MYQIVAKTGWRTAANTEHEAKQLADRYHLEWYEQCGRNIEVNVYYFGTLVYTVRRADLQDLRSGIEQL